MLMVYCFSYLLKAMCLMLHVCEQYADDFSVKFNSRKFVAMHTGCHYGVMCEPLELVGESSNILPLQKLLVVFDHFHSLQNVMLSM